MMLSKKNAKAKNTFNKYNLGLNFCTNISDGEEDEIYARYFQCGIEDKQGRFTGHIYDYVGGGEYMDFYFVNGELLGHNGEDPEVDSSWLDDDYPGLSIEIDSFESKFFIYEPDEGMSGLFRLNERALDIVSRHGDINIENEDGFSVFHFGSSLSPVEIANTSFSGNTEEITNSASLAENTVPVIETIQMPRRRLRR